MGQGAADRFERKEKMVARRASIYVRAAARLWWTSEYPRGSRASGNERGAGWLRTGLRPLVRAIAVLLRVKLCQRLG